MILRDYWFGCCFGSMRDMVVTLATVMFVLFFFVIVLPFLKELAPPFMPFFQIIDLGKKIKSHYGH
jgi:hypothetical protein